MTDDYPRSRPAEAYPRPDGRVVYVLPQESVYSTADSELSLAEVFAVLWRGKWWIAGITLLSFSLAIPYALNQTEWYRADVLLAPARERSAPAVASQLGGLADLAGVRVGGTNNAEAIAVLTSRDLIREFITDLGLLPVFYSDQWDDQTNEWRVDETGAEPDIREAVRYFRDSILSVREDSTTRLVRLEVEWEDPVLAASWANELVARVNDRMRQRALDEAEANVAYLRDQLATTTLVALEQSIGRLLETEMQKLMLAQGAEEFAFVVLDRAEVPARRSRPRRSLIVVLWTFLGGMGTVLVLFIAHAIGNAKKRARRGVASVEY